MNARADIVKAARGMLGTPFHHMGRAPAVGLDCAGLLICVARAVSLVHVDFDVPAYRPMPDGHSMRAWCEQYLHPVESDAMQPGDVVLMIVDAEPQHLGILGDYAHGGLSIIHAAGGARPPRVIETRLMWSRVQRFVAAYAFPGVA